MKGLIEKVLAKYLLDPAHLVPPFIKIPWQLGEQMALKEQLRVENEQLQCRPAVDHVPFELEKRAVNSLTEGKMQTLKETEQKLQSRLFQLETEKREAWDVAKRAAEQSTQDEVKLLQDKLDGQWRVEATVNKVHSRSF